MAGELNRMVCHPGHQSEITWMLSTHQRWGHARPVDGTIGDELGPMSEPIQT